MSNRPTRQGQPGSRHPGRAGSLGMWVAIGVTALFVGIVIWVSLFY